MEFLAGNRISGTTAEKDTLQAVTGGWKELGRVTASVGEVTGLADKRYLMVLGHHIQGSGNSGLGLQFNGDTGSNYPRRYSANGGSDATPTSETNIFFDTNGSTVSGKEWFTTMYIANKSDKEKLGIYHSTFNRNGLGSGQHPHRQEGVFKWTNTSDSISSIKFSDFNGTAMNSASEVVVLGWDPSDTHSTNFWEQLASVNASGSSTNLSSGTITAKKYLWVQVYANDTSSLGFQFNNDTGSNYARRWSYNGGTDGTSVSQSSMNIPAGVDKTFTNMFIINNSAYEKLCIGHDVYINGSGAGNDPERAENVGKWANTSAQITEIDVNKTGNFDSDSFIKVWGSN